MRPAATARATIGAAVATATILLTAPPAWAHGNVVSTSPSTGSVVQTAPTAVMVTIENPLLVPGAAMVLKDPDGQITSLTVSVDGTTMTAPLPALEARGTYVVSFRAACDDGHITSGSFLFSVGEPSAQVPTAVELGDGPGSSSPLVMIVVSVLGLGGFLLAVRARRPSPVTNEPVTSAAGRRPRQSA